MGIVNQPKPTEPKGPVGDQQPLQPGHTPAGKINEPTPLQPNPKRPSDSGPVGEDK